ncbi:hypothetical protein ACSYAD_29245 [Acaryochloris marina NIES-2412]|uniref:hypothetical protein n=1 Tax=Acaryochloris marina TaxID=155978 RepID=UPI004059F9B4
MRINKSLCNIFIASQILLLGSFYGSTEPAHSNSRCPGIIVNQLEYYAREIVTNKLAYLLPSAFDPTVETCTYVSNIDVVKAKVHVYWKHPSERIFYQGRLQILQSSEGVTYSLINADNNLRGHLNDNWALVQQKGAL